jgi:hypothetical protein
MKLIFVHGWSVTNTNTYRDLPNTIASQSSQNGLQIDINHIHLGKYISFHDEVSLDDIARAMQQALLELPGNEREIQPFSCITHSTGGPLVRYWANKYYGEQKLSNMPLQHLVMLAPANHGSGLAALGQKRVSRIKSWFSGVEPGRRVLDWLRLGSNGQFELNSDALAFDYGQNGFFPFVITGQGIDTKAYDFINNYLVENGSDGVIRVAGANLNCRFISLEESNEQVDSKASSPFALKPAGSPVVKKTNTAPLMVLKNASHSGGKMGVLNSNKSRAVHQDVADKIFQCLSVKTDAEFNAVEADWVRQTAQEQGKVPDGKKRKIGRYGMLVFRVKDSAGDVIDNDDYDVLMLAGKKYSPDELPSGFFVDRQANTDSQALVYYVDIDKMHGIKDELFGITIIARPEKGFSYYRKAEFRADETLLRDIFAPNETTYIDITLQRQVDQNVFRFAKATKKQGSFKNTKPAGKTV